jgi:hypothetical protein
MRILILAVGLLAAATLPAAAQRKLTCTQVYKRCLTYNAGYGPREVRRCERGRDACLKSGEWHSRAFDYKDLTKQ